MTEPLLTIRDVSFSYSIDPTTPPILDHLNLSIQKGEIVAIHGRSGVGKSTLFKLIAGILKPTGGTLNICSGTIVGLMMQDDLLLPWRNVIENVVLPTELGKRKEKEAEGAYEQAAELLKEVGLEQYLYSQPDTLSGGMRQRVSLARALMQNASLLLLDEPFGSLDMETRKQLYELIRTIRDKYNTTILLITHDDRDANMLAQRCVEMEDLVVGL